MPERQLTRFQAIWIRIWMSFILIGLFLFIIGVDPDLIGMDRSPVVGFVQVGVWLFGLALFLFGAYASLHILHGRRPNTLRAEIGERLIATGYVVASAASLADFIGIGSHSIPNLAFGPIQVIGLIAGILTSLIGVGLYWPPRSQQEDKPAEAALAKDLQRVEGDHQEG